MNNKTKDKNGLVQSLGIPAAVILAYIGSVCALPSSGLLTTIPFAVIFAAITSFICKDRKIIYIAVAVMNILTTVLMGYDLKRAVISAIIATASTYFAILCKRAFITFKKTDKKNIKGKSKVVLVISAVICILIWLVFLGNPVSFMLAQDKNTAVAEEKYPGKLETGATFFDVTRFEYVTEITFDAGLPGEKYYISTGKTDDYIGFHIEETLMDAADYFSGRTALPAEALKCYIAKEDFIFGETRENNANYKNTEYLMERSEIVTGMDGFEDLYESLTVYAKQSEDLVYKSFTMTAKDMNGKTYYAHKELGKDVVFFADHIENEPFIKNITEKFN